MTKLISAVLCIFYLSTVAHAASVSDIRSFEGKYNMKAGGPASCAELKSIEISFVSPSLGEIRENDRSALIIQPETFSKEGIDVGDDLGGDVNARIRLVVNGHRLVLQGQSDRTHKKFFTLETLSFTKETLTLSRPGTRETCRLVREHGTDNRNPAESGNPGKRDRATQDSGAASVDRSGNPD